MSWQVELTGRVGTLELDVRLHTDAPLAVVVGPNGAGKTTLLRAIAGAALPLRGEVRLNGRVLMDAKTRLPPEQRRVGYVPQGYGLFPHLCALDNVAFGCRGDRTRARAMLERLDALPLSDRRPRALSGGQQQTVALARALAAEPAGLLLDEPLAALDAKTRRATRARLVSYLERAALPAIVVSHDLRDVLALDGHVFVLEGGRIVQDGLAEGIARSPKTDFVAELFELVG